jgi:hypothetical protein
MGYIGGPWVGHFLFSIPEPSTMNRGSSRQKVFLDTRDYEVFITTIAELHDRWRVEVFSYCLRARQENPVSL